MLHRAGNSLSEQITKTVDYEFKKLKINPSGWHQAKAPSIGVCYIYRCIFYYTHAHEILPTLLGQGWQHLWNSSALALVALVSQWNIQH